MHIIIHYITSFIACSHACISHSFTYMFSIPFSRKNIHFPNNFKLHLNNVFIDKLNHRYKQILTTASYSTAWRYAQEPWEETVRALARRCGSTHSDLGGDSQGIGQEMWQYSQRPGRRQSGHWPGDVAVLTGTWGGDSQGTGQKRLRYAQGPGEETVRALARRGRSTHRGLGRRQSGHWPGEVAVCTRTWGGDSQGTGQEMWQYSQRPGRRQSGHWPGDVAVLTGTWGGDSQGTGQKRLRYAQGPGEETVRALARRCGSTHRDLGRRQPVRTGTWGGDSQGTGQEMWQNSQGPGEETASTHRDLGRRQSGHWPEDVAELTGPGDEQVRALARRCGSMHVDQCSFIVQNILQR